MRYRSRKRFTVGALAVALIGGSVATTISVSPVSAAPVTLTFLTFNDFHGRINKAEGGNPPATNTARFATTIENLRAAAPGGEASTLLLSGGDNIGASEFTSSSANDQPTIDVLNALEVDASTVGNHEFDKGFSDLKDRVIGGANGVDFPYLGANVYAKGTTTPVLEEYAIFDMGGVTVGVIGAVTGETPSLVTPAGITTLDFGDPVVAVNRVAEQLQDGNAANGEAEILIAEYHEGATVTTSLGAAVAASTAFASIVNDTSNKVDVIFNGHSHNAYAFDAPIPVVGGTRPIVQTGSYGGNIGQVQLTLDDSDNVVSGYVSTIVATNTTPINLALPRVNAVNTIVTDAIAAAAVIGNVPVATVTADITTAWKTGGYVDGVYTGGRLSTDRDDRTNESTLGNVVADALLDTLEDPLYGEAEIAVVNAGGLRNELYYDSDGVLTYAESNAVLPFVNNLWTTSLTGAQFKQVLEEQWQRNAVGVPNGAYLQLNLSDNVTYTFDPARSLNDRITSISIDGYPIDPTASYRVGTFSFLATGGDNYHTFKQGTNVKDTGLVDRDAWIAYLTANSPVSPDFARQSVIATGVLPTAVTAGSNISLSLEKLNLTSLGSRQNTSVEVFLGGVSLGSVAVDNTVPTGKTAISLIVPNSVPSGLQPLQVVAQGSNTTVTIPVTVTSPTPSTPYKPLIFSQEPPVSIPSVRLADSREGVGFAKAPLVQGTEYKLVVAGKSGVPATAKAVAVNVTALNSTVDGFINVYPCGSNPLASALNQVPGKIVANLTMVDIGVDGAICFQTNTATDVIVDLQTYYGANSDFESLTPNRIVDTRVAVGLPSKLSANVPVKLKVAGVNGVPADASSVVLNLTSAESPAGFITAYPCGTVPPLASNVNTWEGHAIANLAVVGVGADGEICFRSSNTTHLVIDLQGYFGAGADYNALTPVRALDTRVTKNPLVSNVFREIPIAGLYGVPKIADQVTINVTAVDAVGPAFITVYSCGTLPVVSSGNTSPDRITATLAVVDLSDAGSICVLSNLKTDLVVDVQGWVG